MEADAEYTLRIQTQVDYKSPTYQDADYLNSFKEVVSTNNIQ